MGLNEKVPLDSPMKDESNLSSVKDLTLVNQSTNSMLSMESAEIETGAL